MTQTRPHPVLSDGVTDPLLGSQRTTDSTYEASHTPPEEVALAHPPHGRARRSRKVAAALAILLGWVGAHRFYLGFRNVGMFQLLVTLSIIATAIIIGFSVGDAAPGYIFATTVGALFVMMLWGLFEGIFILAGVLESDVNDHPLR